MPQEHDWFLFLWAFVCIVVVLGMSYWVTRFVAGKGLLRTGAKRGGNGRIEILAQELIGKDQRLVIVRTGGRYFLLGAASGSISLLAELSEEEAVAAAAGDAGETQTLPGFFESFSETLKKRMGR